MALAITDNLTEWDDADTDNWSGDPTVGLDDTDFFIEGTGAIGVDVDIETQDIFGASQTATDLSNNYIYMWVLSLSATTLELEANGGIQIAVSDGSGESYWNVAGSDTYGGGWKLVSVSTALTPDRTVGGGATLTSITQIGVSFTNTAKSKSTQNCFVDWIRYGTGPAYTVTGTTTTAGTGWDEVYSLDNGNTIGGNPAPYGIMISQPGGYALNGPIQIGDTAGTATTDFTDIGTNLAFVNLPVGNSHYGITIGGNATGTTDVVFGTVVGTGDDRQGVGGGSISTDGPSWYFDGDTNIANIDALDLYGVRWSGANEGIGLDDATKTSVISSQFTNCGPITTGATSDGAEILNSTIIDPNGTTNNYGIQFDQTPSGGTLSTTVKNINFITSGTPTTQYMTALINSSDYSIVYSNFKFFGDYTSGTIQHGINTGTNADVEIQSINGSTVLAAEFTNTNSGTVTVVNNIEVNVTRVLGNSEIKVLPTAGSPYSGNTLNDTLSIATETVSADTNTGDGGSNYIGYTNNGGFVQINANGTTAFTNFPGVLQDTNSAAPRNLAAGDKVRVTIRDNADNPRLDLFDEFTVSGTPSASTILTTTSFTGFTSAFGTTLNSANSKIVTTEKVDARYRFSVANNTAIDLLVFRTGSNPILSLNTTITAETNTFPSTQTVDRNYLDPA